MGGGAKKNAREGFLRALIFDDECMSQEGQGCQWGISPMSHCGGLGWPAANYSVTRILGGKLPRAALSTNDKYGPFYGVQIEE